MNCSLLLYGFEGFTEDGVQIKEYKRAAVSK